MKKNSIFLFFLMFAVFFIHHAQSNHKAYSSFDRIQVAKIVNGDTILSLSLSVLDSSYRQFVKKLNNKSVFLSKAYISGFNTNNGLLPYLILEGNELASNRSVSLAIKLVFIPDNQGGKIVFLSQQAKETHACSGSPCDYCKFKRNIIFGDIIGCSCAGSPSDGFCNHTVTTTKFSFTD